MSWLHSAGAWSVDWSVWAGCGVALLAYLWLPGRRLDRRALAWVAGVLIVFVALESGIDQVGDNYLFSAHMAQHLILAMVAPPLLVWGLPREATTALRQSWLGTTLRWLFAPALAGPAYLAILVGWHIPPLFEYALTHPAIHISQHLSFIAAGVVFWGAVRSCRPTGPSPWHGRRTFIFLMGCGALPGLLVGLTLALLPDPAYSYYLHRSVLLGISPLADQRLGGWLMFLFDTVLMGTAAIVDLRHPAPSNQVVPVVERSVG
ncbi:MAG: cytochrome c oxidase assembly protein [Candidatus Dormibacteria bacterium]